MELACISENRFEKRDSSAIFRPLHISLSTGDMPCTTCDGNSNLILIKIKKTLIRTLKWRFPASVIELLLFCVVTYAIWNSKRAVQIIQNAINSANANVTYLELRVDPPEGTFIEAACFQQNKIGHDTEVDHRTFSKYGVIKWTAHNSDGVYFCDALQGKIGSIPTLSTRDFAVYGDFVSKKNCTWLVDFLGRRRILEENGKLINEFVGRWHQYPHSDSD